MPHRFEQRSLATALFQRGIRNPYVMFKEWRIPYSTASRYCRQLRAGESLDDRPRSGRPLKLTPALLRQLQDIKAQYPKKQSAFYARRLSAINERRISGRSVRRGLRRLGYTWRLRPRRMLTPVQKQARLQFARAHRNDAWDKVWFFDESYFNLYRHGNRYWVKVETDDAFSLPKLTERQEAVSVGIAVAIRHGRKSSVGFLPKNWKAADLVRIFDTVLLPSMTWSNRGENLNTLVLDNDGRHYSAAWLQYVERKHLRPIRPWAPNSPDINVIENLFAWLKARVEDAEPHDEPSLREAIQTAWDAVPLSMTETLVESLPRRLAQVIRGMGARTKY